MTAQVAVLTRLGIALASDSAVTVIDGEGGSRSYPSADKIFPVTGVPVAVMHSGNAALAGVPWELLVDNWAKSRPPVELDSMAAYASEFAGWLRTQEQVAGPVAQDELARWCFRDCMYAVVNRAKRRLDEEGHTEPVQDGALIGPAAVALNECLDEFIGWLEQYESYPGLDEVAGDKAAGRLATEIIDDLDLVFDGGPRTPHVDQVAPRMFSLLVHKTEPFSIDATLAFIGYADGDYFPSAWSGTYTGVVENVVRVSAVATDEIGPSNSVCINPYGLTDAIHMFLKGQSPQYREVAHQALDELYEHVESPTHVGDRSGLQVAHEDLEQKFDELEWDGYLKPMLDVVGALPLAEMVRFADSLVGLASLRQLINGDSSVGGPIDVARITRNHGFEWVRWKRASDPTL